MLSLKTIEKEPEKVILSLNRRNKQFEEIIKKILSLNEERKKLETEYSQKKALLNSITQEISKNKRKNNNDPQLIENAKILKNNIKNLENLKENIEKEIHTLLITLPNLPASHVPDGSDSSQNVIIKTKEGYISSYPNKIPHWEIGRKSGILDFSLGSKLAGSGFYVWQDKGCALVRALITFFIEKATKAGYVEILPPLLVNENTAFGTGQIPDKDEQMYYIPKDGFYLIPTAEVPVTNLYANSIINEELLPIKHVSYTPCFRREAGSWGKDVRGLNRVHQFDKVEIVQITHPNLSYQALDDMVNYVCFLVEELQLPYRVVKLCAGDLGFASACTYDIEIYASGQDKWLETSSVSNFETFQSIRMNLRVRDKNGNLYYPHTLNGSALALARLLACILENYQEKDGVKIPPPLIPYTKFDFIPYKF